MTRDRTATPRQLLGRRERHEQLVTAATRAFARDGFAATSLEDIAAEAGVTKAIIYRHFDSKTELYREALDTIRARIRGSVGSDDQLTANSIGAVIRAAAEDPDGYRLLFEHAAREAEFHSYSDELTRASIEVAETHLRQRIPEPGMRRWIAALLVRVQHEIVLSWLQAGMPVTADDLASTVRATSRTLIQTAVVSSSGPRSTPVPPPG